MIRLISVPHNFGKCCIADDVLRDVYVRGKYRDVILPMTVLRRLDCLLEPTKEKVLE
ncbi:SAM-dependent DNA methyltransferase, partial [Nostoc sp. HG1]|nr:SAM-dependent DNA methyltransferase [Nostoc sp. HG1]